MLAWGEIMDDYVKYSTNVITMVSTFQAILDSHLERIKAGQPVILLSFADGQTISS